MDASDPLTPSAEERAATSPEAAETPSGPSRAPRKPAAKRTAKPASRTSRTGAGSAAAAAAASSTTASPRSRTAKPSTRGTSSRSASTSSRTRATKASVPPAVEPAPVEVPVAQAEAPAAPVEAPAVELPESQAAPEPEVVLEDDFQASPEVIEPPIDQAEQVSEQQVADEQSAPVVIDDLEVPEPPVEDASLVEEAVEMPEAEAEAELAPEPQLAPEPEPAPPADVLVADLEDEPAAPGELAVVADAEIVVDEPVIPVDFGDLVEPGRSGATERIALRISGVVKRYGSVTAVDGVDLDIPAGSFYGIVGPNGAGKTTTLSIATGLLRPDAGTVEVYGADVWSDPDVAKQYLGVLPDRLRLFDRLTGAQLLHYAGALRGLDPATVSRRAGDLARAFGLTSSLSRLVSDYSVGMTKKVAIAAALIHAPRMLVLDEPFESVDPVSSAAVLRVLRRFTEGGGTVLLSSHDMELIESACDDLAIIVGGRVLAAGPVSEVLAGVSLEDRFVELAGGRSAVEGLEWLHSYSA